MFGGSSGVERDHHVHVVAHDSGCCRNAEPPGLVQGLYLLLVTNKASNILEDLETLRLLAKVVPEYVVDLHEEAIAAAAFDLIFAFGEVHPDVSRSRGCRLPYLILL